MRRLAVFAIALAGALPAAASAQDTELVVKRLTGEMRAAGSSSGAYVQNLDTGRVLFRWRRHSTRVLASNTKLFTTAAALARFGTEGTLSTTVLGDGELDAEGVYRGSLYLRGGGDPTFGSRSFARRSYGSGGAVQDLAVLLEDIGIERVTGRVYGDESAFDSLRGGPESGFGVSVWVGPLSGLSFNRGLFTESGRGYQANPPAFAAARLGEALRARGIRVRLKPRERPTPADAELLAVEPSPSMDTVVRITNKPSDNFFAEMLLKAIADHAGGTGTTARGARIARRFAARLGSGGRIADGSGLSRANRASPFRVVRLLSAVSRRDEYDAFRDSLPVAGRDGTLYDRMRSGPARGRCQAKTGTLSNVSALSGYCDARSGDTYVFSVLMNRVYPTGARRLQDRMLQALVKYG